MQGIAKRHIRQEGLLKFKDDRIGDLEWAIREGIREQDRIAVSVSAFGLVLEIAAFIAPSAGTLPLLGAAVACLIGGANIWCASGQRLDNFLRAYEASRASAPRGGSWPQLHRPLKRSALGTSPHGRT